MAAVSVVPTRRGSVEVVSGGADGEASSAIFQDYDDDGVGRSDEDTEDGEGAPPAGTGRSAAAESTTAAAAVVTSSSLLRDAPSPSERKKLQRLSETHPTATPAEVKRFAAAHRNMNAATKKLGAYLRWREENVSALLGKDAAAANPAGDDSSSSEAAAPRPMILLAELSDSEIWDACAKAAASRLGIDIHLGEGRGRGRGNQNNSDKKKLPRLVRMVGSDNNDSKRDDGQDDDDDAIPQRLLDADGHRILYVLPAMLDTTLAPSSLYALTTALYLDSILDRSTCERMTMVIDVRPGRGWPNPTPNKVVPYLRSVSKIGAEMFPERLARAIVVPMPGVAIGLWNMIKGVLDKRHVARVRLVGGTAGMKSRLPVEGMGALCDEGVVGCMERCRASEFR